MSRVDFKQMPTELGEKQKQFGKAMAYVIKVGEPSKIVDDQISYSALFFIKYMLNEDEGFLEQTKDWRFLTKSKFGSVLIGLFEHLVDFCDEFVIENVRLVRANSINIITDLNERRISILDYLIVILNKLASIFLYSIMQLQVDLFLKNGYL
jgi:hypothetical protein